MREIETADGKLVLTEAALAGVAAAAALRCPGVVATAGRAAREPLGRGVEVELDAERCAVSLDIVVAYGARLADVCRAVRAAVTEALEAAAGLRPDRVEVRIVGVRAERAQPAGEPAGGRPA
jgi:uncharacterized alkaline shock family protein YloU